MNSFSRALEGCRGDRVGSRPALVKAPLVKHADEPVMIYIGDAPIEITRKMPKTFKKLVNDIEQQQGCIEPTRTAAEEPLQR